MRKQWGHPSPALLQAEQASLPQLFLENPALKIFHLHSGPPLDTLTQFDALLVCILLSGFL